MITPIFLVDENDVDTFRTVDEAERYIEPIDIPTNVVFDASGRVLRLVAVAEYVPRRFLKWRPSVERQVTRIELTDEFQSTQLTEILRRWVRSVYPERWKIDQVDIDKASLRELVVMMEIIKSKPANGLGHKRDL